MIIHGDCLEVLRTMYTNSIDSMVTDPPAGISFMGKEWDKSDGFIPFMTEVMTEALRVLKPGAHALVWAIPRTSHWTATALEDAGFEIRDVITHLFGSGFPKSLDISKAIDKSAGAKREIVGYRDPKGSVHGDAKPDSTGSHIYSGELTSPKGVTDAAKQHQGWGTALKPASEHWILCRKPLSEKTVAANVLKWGTGGINIDGSRVAGPDQEKFAKNWDRETQKNISGIGTAAGQGINSGIQNTYTAPKGRFPANLILDEVAAEMLGEPSRFFYCAKASKSERNLGCEGLPVQTVKISGQGAACPKLTKDGRPNKDIQNYNHHPTVKPTKLMSYLINLITPIGGTVLDPFMGSGSTGVAAIRDGFSFIGIEKEAEYLKIAEKRINNQGDNECHSQLPRKGKPHKLQPHKQKTINK